MEAVRAMTHSKYRTDAVQRRGSYILYVQMPNFRSRPTGYVFFVWISGPIQKVYENTIQATETSVKLNGNIITVPRSKARLLDKWSTRLIFIKRE